MSKAKHSQNKGKKRVKFLLEAAGAKETNLLGDFNNWNSRTHPMKKNPKGVWEKTIMLFPGRYEYRFLVDGEWWNDPLNNQVCINSYGSQNNIIIVSAK